MKNLLVKIRESLCDLSETDSRIAQFVLQHEKEMPQLRISQVAEGSNASQASVVRFCKIFGTDGFKEFRRYLTTDILEQALKQEQVDKYTPTDLTENEDITSILERVANNNIQSIRETKKLLSVQDLEKAITFLSNAPRIDFFGFGASGTVALDAYQKFIRIGKTCNMSQDSHIQMTLASSLHKGDAAVVISYSGKTKDCLENATVAKEQGASVIAITKYGSGNPLAELADSVLYATSPEGVYRSGATSSRIAQLTIIDILFAGIASRDISAYYKNLENTYKYAALKKLP